VYHDVSAVVAETVVQGADIIALKVTFQLSPPGGLLLGFLFHKKRHLSVDLDIIILCSETIILKSDIFCFYSLVRQADVMKI
jgi:hypothetical protein